MEKNPNYLSTDDFKFIFSKVPRICIDLVIEDVGGILLSKRAIEPGNGLWHLPGGGILMGETFEDAAIRIALNETGLDIDELELLSVIEFPEADNPFYHAISIVFYVGAFEGELSGDKQSSKLEFFKKLPDPMVNEHKLFLEGFISGNN